MPEFKRVVRRLEAGAQLSDPDFDRIYPDWARRLSDVHWTPVDIARRAAELLAVDSNTRILDVGSGVGKFCLIGALSTTATFLGVEQRDNLVQVARQTSQRCGVARTQFIHGNMLDLDWNKFDAFYLYNPFYEHISADYLTPIETVIELDPDLFRQYVVATCNKLLSAREGTRVVTYHGFGGVMPHEYRLLLREPAGSSYLEVWEK